MKDKLFKVILIAIILTLTLAIDLKAGEPCCHIMICCKTCNKGVSFYVNGKWNSDHDYADINQVRDVMQKIKDTGIKTVIIDMTNPSQWTYLWNMFYPMINNIQQVCREKEMQFFIFIGAQLTASTKTECNIPAETDAFEFWNGMAEHIWNTWAKDPTYRKYGYGDDRPMIIAFSPAQSYWGDYNSRPAAYKTYLSKFYIGTTQVNDPVTPGETDGWGYRKSIGNPAGTIRYTSPNGGVDPGSWFKISAEAFAKEVQWASEATHYSIYGSYDDTCDGIFWGIANTKNSTSTVNNLVYYNRYPDVNNPFVYYSMLKSILNPRLQPEAPAFLYSVAGDHLISLDWADNVETDFAGNYSVYRSKSQGGPYILLSKIPESKFDDKSAANDTTYYYVVTAFAKNGSETGYSNETSAKATGRTNYIYKYDFNTAGNLEGWIGNDHVGGLVQATSLNGVDGVLKSDKGIKDIDPRLFQNATLALPDYYKSWKSIEMRVRQIGKDQKTPQFFDPQGTIAYFLYPEVYAPGEIKWPEFQLNYEPEGEWITAIADISAIGTKPLTLTFVDLIGNATGIGKNFELDYVYLMGYLQGDTIKGQTPFVKIEVPGKIEFEDFDNGGVKIAYLDDDFKNQGGAWRPIESVDIGEKNTGGYYVGWCTSGEWLEYTFDVKTLGEYKAILNYAAESGNNKILFSFNEKNMADTIQLPATGDAQKWGSFDFNLNFTPGAKVMRIKIIDTAGSLNLDNINFTLVKEISPGTGKGLEKTFWTGEIGGRNWFKDSVCTEIDPLIDETWADVSPGCNLPKDFWNVRWRGQIEPLYSEEYTFYLTVNNMGRLWVNDVLLIDAWISTASGKTHTGKISLVAGQKVNIRLDFAEVSGDASVKLEWESQSNSREVVPESQLYSESLNTSAKVLETNEIKVYPNPASDRITIESNSSEIKNLTITDICGRIVFETRESFRGVKTIEINYLKNGIYIFKLGAETQEYVKKIIKR